MAQAKQKLTDILDEFDHVMLVTRRGDELRSRPMQIADHTDDGRIRFITRDDSGKLEELEESDSVNVAMQSPSLFASVSGRARLSKDRRLVEEAWSTGQKIWFADGRDDTHVIVLEVVPTFAEYWDRSGANALELIVAKTRGDTADRGRRYTDVGEHGEVDFSDKPL